jgi:hypothetical protein
MVVYDLLRAGKHQHLLTLGFEKSTQAGMMVEPREINFNKGQLVTKQWERVHGLLGDAVFTFMLKNFLVFEKTADHSLVQLAGTNVWSFFGERPGAAKDAAEVHFTAKHRADAKSHKYRLKDATDMYQRHLAKGTTEDMVCRTRLFYCNHMNRKNAFFQKHKIFSEQTPEDQAAKIYQEQFGFMRVRRSLQDQLMKILVTTVKSVREFNFNYYLHKNAPLPDNWKERKVELMEMAKDEMKRKQVYKELFEHSNVTNTQVGNLLTEFVAQVCPGNLLGKSSSCKNKKVLNQKIHQFVKFNRQETFTRVTLLEKFRIHDIPWMQFSAKHKNATYFQRENEYVWWCLLKWIFEDLLTSVIRCYFYVTEKQKEYARIFYYRKNVWNMVMKLGTEDLLRQNMMAVKKQEMRAQCESHNFAPAKLRLIPKGDTFRPIMTFNRKLPHTRTSTTNRKLGRAHTVLKTLKSNMHSERFGFAVFNYDDIMKRYEQFVNKWKAAGQPELYFVTMDIEKCYDSVDARRLCEFLRGTVLIDREYSVLTCLSLRRRNNVLGDLATSAKEPIRNHFRHRFQKLCVDAGSCPSLKEVLGDDNDFNCRRSLLVEYEARGRLLKSEVLQTGGLEYIV